jgi:hypothetical protein
MTVDDELTQRHRMTSWADTNSLENNQEHEQTEPLTFSQNLGYVNIFFSCPECVICRQICFVKSGVAYLCWRPRASKPLGAKEAVIMTMPPWTRRVLKGEQDKILATPATST